MSSRSAEDNQPEEEADTYFVESILAEKWQEAWDTKPVDEGIKYLTKWEGYPLWECTWEPAANFDPPPEVPKSPKLPPASPAPPVPTALDLWNEKKARMSEPDFLKLCRTNIARYEAARETAGDDVDPEPLVSENEGRNEDVVSSRSQRRNSQRQAPPLEVALAEREAADSSQLNALFMESPKTATTNAIRQPPKARKPPVVQSDSSLSSSEAELTDDSMLVEITTTSKETRRRPTSAGSDTERRATRKSAQSPRSTLKRAATTPHPKSATKPSLAKPAHGKETEMPSRTGRIATGPTQRRASTTSKPTSAATGSNSAACNTVAPGCANPGTAKRSVSFATQPSSVKTTSDTGKNSGIRIVNEPKTQPRQIAASKTMYSTLQQRAAAQKKSVREGTPDVSALEFLDPPPGAPISIPKAPGDDPYGRREPSRRRITEVPRSDEPLSRHSAGADTSLESWELEKVPLVCYSWRLSNNCKKSAQECRFMHRNKDENGRDYPLGDVQGFIPPKHRRPPLTCAYWLNCPTGCKKSAEDCQFAHKNTGWMKHIDSSIRDVQIDPQQRPKFDITKGRLGDRSTRRALRPSGLTCWYWKKDRCRKDQKCAFRHEYKDGDIVADPPFETHHGSVSAGDDSDGMDIDDTIQPDVADEVTRTPSPIPFEQPQQDTLQPQPPPPPPMEFPPVKITCKELQASAKSVCKLDFEDIFASNDGEEPASPVERRAFVMFHSEDHSVELGIITRWLLEHHVQVSSPGYEGGWAHFRQQIQQGGSGVIIVHPDVEHFTDIPGFGQLLRRGVRLWSVGRQPGVEYDYASDENSVIRNDCIEIFPIGGFIYITDEVFELKPRLAFRIIELFIAKLAKLKELASPSAEWSDVVENSLLWRLCVRPELMEHLYQYCEDQATELHAGDADLQSCAKLYEFLANPNYIEQDSPQAPLSLKTDKHPILSERRVFAECEPVNYFKTLESSKKAANLSMIRYYAGLQVDMRRDYRHFYVVHTDPTASYVKEWKNEIQTIAEVITPEQCIREFKKSGQDSMFQFYEEVMAEDMGSKGPAKGGGDATARAG